MKNYILGFIVAILSTYAHAQVESRDLKSFNSISVSSGIQVNYQLANQYGATVKADNEKLLQHIKTEIKGNTLYMYVKNGDRSLHFKAIKIDVYGPADLKQLSISSGANLYIEPSISSANITANISAAGSLKAKLKAENIHINASSSGNFKGEIISSTLGVNCSSTAKINATGSAKEANINASSASKIEMQQLHMENATIDASSTASVKIHVSGKLKASASSNACVAYAGKPETTDFNYSANGRIQKL